MFSLPQLNDQSLEQMLYGAIQKLQQYHGQWTDVDIHDPGITYLELLAVLQQEQRKNIDMIGTRNLMKFLKLLHITPDKAECAKVNVMFNTTKDGIVMKNMQAAVEDIKYETKDTIEIFANRICKIGSGSTAAVNLFYYDNIEYDRNTILFSQNKEGMSCFYIGLEKPLSPDKTIRFFFQLKEKMPLRNPYAEGFIPLSQVEWEYYGVEDGEIGWHPAVLLQDETIAFLYSGEVLLQIKGCMQPKDEVYLLRIKCIRYGYEEAPCLSCIMLNSVRMYQKNTLCESIYFSLEDFRNNLMMVDSDLARENTYQLYIGGQAGFRRAEDMDIHYLLVEQDNGLYRLGTSNRSQLQEEFFMCQDTDSVLKLVLYREDFFEGRFLTGANGTANQEFIIQGCSGLLYDAFELMIQQNGVWEEWKKVDSLDGCKNGDKVYMLHGENGAIRFGDNIHGKVPASSKVKGNNICIVSLVQTLGAEGHIKAFALNYPESSEQWEFELVQWQNSYGGRNASTTQELLEKAQTFLENPSRAVTLEDYERLAYQTPGLKIGKITAIPLYRPGMAGYPQQKAENTVTLVVEPYTFSQQPNVIEGYVKNVQRFINPYRLITTGLFVTGAVYVPMDIYGEIRLVKTNQKQDEILSELMKDCISKIQKQELGQTIFYGDIYRMLEELDFVEQVKYLQMDVPMEMAEKTVFGDVKIPPHSRIYLNKCNITFY